MEMKKLVELFMADNCTKFEAERHIKNGSEAIKASEWTQYIKTTTCATAKASCFPQRTRKKSLTHAA